VAVYEISLLQADVAAELKNLSFFYKGKKVKFYEVKNVKELKLVTKGENISIPFMMEYWIEEISHAVDIKIGPSSKKICLEIDGPSHFAVNFLGKPLGNTAYRSLLFRKEKWSTACIHHISWDQSTKRKELLKSVLESLIDPLFYAEPL
jgi:RAP domain